MPDITMCDNAECKVCKTCYRNPESGTKPSDWRQSWFAEYPGNDEMCEYYWPKMVRS